MAEIHLIFDSESVPKKHVPILVTFQKTLTHCNYLLIELYYLTCSL